MILAIFIITVTMNNAQIINVFTYQDPYLIYYNSDLMSAMSHTPPGDCGRAIIIFGLHGSK